MSSIVPIPSEVINWDILSEIVSMDEDNPDFSKELIIQYIDQAETTFGHIEAELNGSCDLTQLASLGHFCVGLLLLLDCNGLPGLASGFKTTVGSVRVLLLARKTVRTLPNLSDKHYNKRDLNSQP